MSERRSSAGKPFFRPTPRGTLAKCVPPGYEAIFGFVSSLPVLHLPPSLFGISCLPRLYASTPYLSLSPTWQALSDQAPEFLSLTLPIPVPPVCVT